MAPNAGMRAGGVGVGGGSNTHAFSDGAGRMKLIEVAKNSETNETLYKLLNTAYGGTAGHAANRTTATAAYPNGNARQATMLPTTTTLTSKTLNTTLLPPIGGNGPNHGVGKSTLITVTPAQQPTITKTTTTTTNKLAAITESQQLISPHADSCSFINFTHSYELDEYVEDDDDDDDDDDEDDEDDEEDEDEEEGEDEEENDDDDEDETEHEQEQQHEDEAERTYTEDATTAHSQHASSLFINQYHPHHHPSPQHSDEY